MDEIKWIKIVTDVFDNRKIKLIESMPEGDTILIIWFKILTLAGQINDGGLIYFTKDIPYTDQLLATQFNRPLSIIQLAMQTFERLGMVEITNEIIMVSNWEKYQSVDGMEKIREQTRKRVARYRENQKALICNVTSNATVTQSNAPEIEKRNKKKNNTPLISPQGDSDTEYKDEFEELWKRYPKKHGKPNALRDYIKARKSGVKRETIDKGLTAYIAYCERTNRYFKDGSTWFHQQAWDDGYEDDLKVSTRESDFDRIERLRREGRLDG